MSIDLTHAGTAARTAAADAARAARLSIVEVEDIDTLANAARLMDLVWSNSDEAPLISASTLKALAHSGGYVAVAFSDAEIVGALIGFLGWLDGDLQLHSHILGVSPALQDRSIGFALKQHQRAWALERDIDTITWTFDPLVRRNAYFNLAKLGARVVGYQPHFYGPMRDALNVGDETDRAVVCWRLDRVEPAPADTTGVVVLRAGEDGRPVVDKSDADVLKAWVPEDVVALRQHDPETALAWRTALRDTLGSAVGDGYAATDMSRDGWYTIERTGS
jgi:predicted GNAT superfamily acetyltransferase